MDTAPNNAADAATADADARASGKGSDAWKQHQSHKAQSFVDDQDAEWVVISEDEDRLSPGGSDGQGPLAMPGDDGDENPAASLKEGVEDERPTHEQKQEHEQGEKNGEGEKIPDMLLFGGHMVVGIEYGGRGLVFGTADTLLSCALKILMDSQRNIDVVSEIEDVLLDPDEERFGKWMIGIACDRSRLATDGMRLEPFEELLLDVIISCIPEKKRKSLVAAQHARDEKHQRDSAAQQQQQAPHPKPKSIAAIVDEYKARRETVARGSKKAIAELAGAMSQATTAAAAAASGEPQPQPRQAAEPKRSPAQENAAAPKGKALSVGDVVKRGDYLYACLCLYVRFVRESNPELLGKIEHDTITVFSHEAGPDDGDGERIGA